MSIRCSPMPAAAANEWFTEPDPATGEGGLRFSCTMCGNCCSGPEGYVLIDDDEAAALARRLNLPLAEFLDRFARLTSLGPSLIEKSTPHGLDCVFLDRDTIPGKAICGVYEDRPKQCRTWPFWTSILRSRATWERTKRICPGMGRGTHYTVQQIRVLREAIEM